MQTKKGKRPTKAPQLTAAQARTFEGGESLASYIQVAELLATRKECEEAFEECECEPYTDVFTYNRWKAQGYQVQRGQKSMDHIAFVPMKGDDLDAAMTPPGEEPRKRLRQVHTFLFCRCQVKRETN